MRIRRALALSAIVVGAATNATAATITFPDFSLAAGLTLSGDATLVDVDPGVGGNVLRLVPAARSQSGSAFSTAPINATNFSTAFEYRLTNPGGVTDASGLFGAGRICLRCSKRQFEHRRRRRWVGI